MVLRDDCFGVTPKIEVFFLKFKWGVISDPKNVIADFLYSEWYILVLNFGVYAKKGRWDHFKSQKISLGGLKSYSAKKNPVENGSMLKLGLPYPSLFQLDLYKWPSVHFKPPSNALQGKDKYRKGGGAAKCKMQNAFEAGFKFHKLHSAVTRCSTSYCITTQCSSVRFWLMHIAINCNAPYNAQLQFKSAECSSVSISYQGSSVLADAVIAMHHTMLKKFSLVAIQIS